MTSHEPSPPYTTAVFWPRCTAVDGCTGRTAGSSGGCPAHLRPRDFERFVASLRPGGDLDLRGVTIPGWLLDAVLDAVTGPDGRPHLGRTRFDGAVLPTDAGLRGFCVEGDSSFDGACFLGAASFFDARFFGHVSFRGARFGRNVSFHGVRFHQHTSFEEAVFAGDVLFGEAAWNADASFRRAVFMGAACFDRAKFGRDAAMQAACFGGAVSFRRVQVARHARFERTKFRQGLWLGPLVAGGRIGLADVTAHGGLRVHAAARQVTAHGAAVHGEADFRLRHAELDLEGAVFDGTASVRALAHPIQGLPEPAWATASPRRPIGRDLETGAGPGAGRGVGTGAGAGREAGGEPSVGTGLEDGRFGGGTGAGRAFGTVRVTSLRRVDAKRVRLDGVDLSDCAFLGLRRPDALRLTGGCAFARTPGRTWPRRSPGRAVLADDLAHVLADAPDPSAAPHSTTAPSGAPRSGTGAQRSKARRSRIGWAGASRFGAARSGTGRYRAARSRAARSGRIGGAGSGIGDARLAALYWDLARAAADSGHGRLSRDFRYNALELRRHSEPVPWRRWGLYLMWMTCGYGLRAGRAVAWLAFIVALVCCGATLLGHDNDQEIVPYLSAPRP
ncbi:pentapeptide repeat-containing protein [Actinomadura decatromicini]|uniref:Pentapeptide repeat-containing protein n=1 Tax=Actinomadura decatromicini TaxID=2604572 RepID=A0A5D3FFK0_9ACTN|nr:pentapeptide repeat-containing protein [Actinomadura decatromicini]TYK46738.1 pentapeptide repeat-containing protein [Actinomadura decatromicini]